MRKSRSIVASLVLIRSSLLLIAILIPFLLTPLASFAAPGTNAFTGSAYVSDQVTFTTTGSMNNSRFDHIAILLQNGKVLVAGGNDSDSAEVYDLGAGTWTTTNSMNVARNGHTATLLPNGKVLVAGGFGGSTALASAELYDPVTGLWSTTGSLNVARYDHTATLLPTEGLHGKVLVVGGYSGSAALASAELYDIATGTWTATDSMDYVRWSPTATLLANGKVLVAGGSGAGVSAELFDPSMGSFSTTGSMNGARFDHTATLLSNGQVLVAGGTWGGVALASAELYNPTTGMWSVTASLSVVRNGHTATLLSNGKVLVAGGYLVSLLSSTELYDPATGLWITTGNMNNPHNYHTATLLNNGQVLIAGGRDGKFLNSAELSTFSPANTLTGTLILPSGWTNSVTISAQFVGASTAAAINAGALSNDNAAWGSWITATPNVTVTTSWTVSGEGANRLVYLGLRDVNSRTATIISGTVNVDLTKPNSTMDPLPAIAPAVIALFWSGSDALSGISTYDVQVRIGAGGTWTDILTNTISTTTNYTGSGGISYYFRVRATDVAGNVEDWPLGLGYDVYTTVDGDAPTGTVVINGGAANTNVQVVTLTLSASDPGSGVSQMSFSNDGSTWGAWQAYAVSASWTLTSTGGDGTKTVYARYQDNAGNVSASATDTITLDTVPPTGTVVIAGGATYVNSINVTLTLAANDATSGVAQMKTSSDGSIWSIWETYTTSKSWILVSGDGAKTAYVQYLDNAGNISAAVTDTIILDTMPPTTAMTSTGTFQSIVTFTISWSGTDTLSGVSTYDIQVRIGADGPWSPVLSNTILTNTTYTGVNGTIYYFRSRARDVAGNLSDWRSDYDLMIILDTDGPSGVVSINDGALSTTAITVTLMLSATDNISVTMMRFSNDLTDWSAWQPYTSSTSWMVLEGDGVKTVYAQFKDGAGNVSVTASDTILLDTAAGSEYGVSINDGAYFTNKIAVTLTLSAVANTTQMRVSNDAGFVGASWEPYSSRKAWTIVELANDLMPRYVYVQYRNADGSVSVQKFDDIYLDITPPVGTIRFSSSTWVDVSARDDISGVDLMLLSHRSDFLGASWEPYDIGHVWDTEANPKAYIRFQDKAGNISRTFFVDAWRLYIPLIGE